MVVWWFQWACWNCPFRHTVWDDVKYFSDLLLIETQAWIQRTQEKQGIGYSTNQTTAFYQWRHGSLVHWHSWTSRLGRNFKNHKPSTNMWYVSSQHSLAIAIYCSLLRLQFTPTFRQRWVKHFQQPTSSWRCLEVKIGRGQNIFIDINSIQSSRPWDGCVFSGNKTEPIAPMAGRVSIHTQQGKSLVQIHLVPFISMTMTCRE